MPNNELPKFSEIDIISIADLEKEIHPEAKLIDYYKLFFQSCFGQGHFIIDMQTARTYLENELISMTHNYYPLVQDISNGKGLYRISLAAIRADLVSIEEFLGMFLSFKFKHIDWEAWSEQWMVILSMLSLADTYFQDRSEIVHCNDYLKQQTIPSHSDSFRLTYIPHYRVMNLDDKNSEIIDRFKEFS